MTTDTIDVESLKHIQRFIWSQGDYTPLAETNLPAAAAIVQALGVGEGDTLLDVAAGDGNVAILAAARGADVVACDLTPKMVELGRARSEAEGETIAWSEADAEDLPFGDNRFDYVTSCFGAMFAPRPERVTSELLRVTRPGGFIALASWTPTGYLGQFITAMAAHLPPPPPGVSPPVLWGDAATVRERLGQDVAISRHTLPIRAESIAALMAEQQRDNGPLLAATIGDGINAVIDDLRPVIERHNQATNGTVAIEAEYLLAVARKGG